MQPLKTTGNLNISSFRQLITPLEIQESFPLEGEDAQKIIEARKDITNILTRRDNRKLIICGPCSIHDPKSALEYALALKELAKEVESTMLLVMRAYFEKPRTVAGWKGLINDPQMDNSFNMNEGLQIAREILIKITKYGIPLATEALEPISPQYLSDLISWTAIGARTTESQTHRELASGLSSPVGFKNNTDGNIEVAINAIKSAQKPHHFLGIDQNGRTSIVSTRGNPISHLILRGGKNGPNYGKDFVQVALNALTKAGVLSTIMIDCSHDNSGKNFKNQPMVFEDCLKQIVDGNKNIIGMMLESHINEGKQDACGPLRYGVSVTDGCISLATTQEIITGAHKQLKKSMP